MTYLASRFDLLSIKKKSRCANHRLFLRNIQLHILKSASDRALHFAHRQWSCSRYYLYLHAYTTTNPRKLKKYLAKIAALAVFFRIGPRWTYRGVGCNFLPGWSKIVAQLYLHCIARLRGNTLKLRKVDYPSFFHTVSNSLSRRLCQQLSVSTIKIYFSARHGGTTVDMTIGRRDAPNGACESFTRWWRSLSDKQYYRTQLWSRTVV